MNRRNRNWALACALATGVLGVVGCGSDGTPPNESTPPPAGAPEYDAQFRTDCADPYLTYNSVPDPNDPNRPSGQQVYFSMAASCDECHLTYKASGDDQSIRWFATCQKEDGGETTNHIDWGCVTACAATQDCDVYNKNGDIKVNQDKDWCKSNSCSDNFCDDSDAGKVVKEAGKVYGDIKKADDGIMSCAESAEGDVDDWYACFKTVVDTIDFIGNLFTGGERVTYAVSCNAPFAGLEEALTTSTSEVPIPGLGSWILANLEAGELQANSFAESCTSCQWSIAVAGDLSETPAKLDASCQNADQSDKSVHIDMNCLYSCALTPNCFVVNEDGAIKVDASQTAVGSDQWFALNYCSTSFKK